MRDISYITAIGGIQTINESTRYIVSAKQPSKVTANETSTTTDMSASEKVDHKNREELVSQ